MKSIPRWVAALVAALAAFAVVSTSPASAEPTSYLKQVAMGFSKTLHVYADPKASSVLSSNDANSLNQQITRTVNPNNNVLVAAMDDSQVAGADPLTLPKRLYDAVSPRLPGNKNAVILVFSKAGFFVQGFNLPAQVASQVVPLADKAKHDKSGNAYGEASQFVNDISRVSVSSTAPGAITPSAQPAKQSGTSGWLIFGIIVAISAAIAVVALFIVNRSKKRRRREKVQKDLTKLERDVNLLSDSVEDIPSEYLSASASHGDAKRAFDRGDLNAAEAHIEAGMETVQDAKRKLSSPAPATHFTSTPTNAPRTTTSSPASSGGASNSQPPRRPADAQAQRGTFTGPGGQTVIINNTTVQPYQTPGYTYFYPGGYVGGMYLPYGYYPSPVWDSYWSLSPLDIVMLDMMEWNAYDRHLDNAYEQGLIDGERRAEAETNSNTSWNSPDTTYDSNVGGGEYNADADHNTDWDNTPPDEVVDSNVGVGTYNSTDTDASDAVSSGVGGGDYDQPVSSPSYEAPAPAPDTTTPDWSSGSSDQSGGGSWNSGGGDSGWSGTTDSGGGGFDSGGSFDSGSW